MFFNIHLQCLKKCTFIDLLQFQNCLRMATLLCIGFDFEIVLSLLLSTMTHLHGLRFYYVVTNDEIKSHTVAAVYDWIESRTGWRSRRCNNICHYSWYVFSRRYSWYVDKNVATKMFVMFYVRYGMHTMWRDKHMGSKRGRHLNWGRCWQWAKSSKLNT